MNLDTTATVESVRSRLLDLFDSVRTSRKNYYARNPGHRPTVDDVPGLIRRTARLNAAISGGVTLIPGPAGMAAAVPELMVILRNQVRMAYDIGVAYGKEDMLDRDLLLGVSLAGSGAGLVGFLDTSDTGTIVRRPTARIAQKLSGMLARSLVKRLLRVFFGHWVPVVGAIVVAGTTRRLTRQMGEQAVAIFSKEIRFAPEDMDADTLKDANADEIRMAILCDLATVDGKAGDEEGTFLLRLASESGMDHEPILRMLEREEPVLVDVTPLSDSERDRLIKDMVRTALANDEVSAAEDAFMARVAGRLKRRDLLDSLLAARKAA